MSNAPSGGPADGSDPVAASPRPASPLAIWRWKLHYQIMLGMLVGALIGWLIGLWAVDRIPEGTPIERAGIVGVGIVHDTLAYIVLQLVGDLFMRGLQLIVVPLVVSSIVLAVYNMGTGRGLGRLGAKTLGYYLCTSFIAIIIGLTLINVVSPGTNSEGIGILQGRDLAAFEEDQRAVEERAAGRTGADFLNVFRQMVPPNPVAAAAEGQLLGLIVVSLVSGFFLARVGGEPQRVMAALTQALYDITMKITHVVLAIAPIGVLGLLAATIAEQYAKLAPDARFGEFLAGIAQFGGVTVASLATHFLLTMSLILLLIARVNPLRHYRAMAPALVTAFSTASSNATLPLTMECVEERAGVSRKTASFVLPLGATANMDGTALYECVAAIFICQAFGVDLTFGQQVMIVVVALLTSIGVAGVPAASLVAIIVILQAVQNQLPPEAPALILGMGLLFVFDRPLDMCRTATNVFSDSVGAVVIARTEGERTALAD
jgi:proton glutamate symport protein